MKVTLKSFANIRDVIGEKELAVELPAQAKLSDLFSYLRQTYGPNFDRQVRDQITDELVPFLILVNEKTYRSSTDMDTPLSEGDTVTIMIPFDGG